MSHIGDAVNACAVKIATLHLPYPRGYAGNALRGRVLAVFPLFVDTGSALFDLRVRDDLTRFDGLKTRIPAR